MPVALARLLAVLAVLAWPCVAASAPQPDRALQHARILVDDIGPRPAGSQQARAAAQYVADAFTRLGLQVRRIPGGTQHIAAIEVAGDEVMPPREITLDDETIVVEIPATHGRGGPAIVVMAHVDTVEDAPGAIDNAAAVGVLVELARALLDEPSRPHDVILAATAGEEIGLVGARALAATLPAGRVGVAISMDLVGRSGPLTLNGLSAQLGDTWLDRIARAATTSDVVVEAPLTHQVVSRLLPQIERSDHGVFTALGIPAFHVFHRGPGRIYLQYHRASDTFDRIDPAAMASALGWLHAFVLDETPLPTAPGAAATWLPFGDAVVVRDGVLFVVELLLLAWCVIGMHRAARTGAPWRTRLRYSAAVWGIALAAWAIALAIESAALRLGTHPQPWVHGPGPWIVATLVLVFGLLTAAAPSLRGASHLPRSAGASAIAMAALPGAVLLWFDIVALAWVPLAQATALAAMGFASRPQARVMLLGVAMLPAWACVDPDLLREATHHHFMPSAPLVAILVVPFAAVSVAATRMLSTLVLATRVRIVIAVIAVAAWIAIAVGAGVGGRQCEAARYAQDGLACELDRS